MRVVVGVAVALIVVAGIGLVVFLLLPNGTLNPFGDSHASVIDGLHDVISQTTTEIEAIRDEPTRDAAVAKLEDLAGQARKLHGRAVKLKPVSDTELKSLTSRFNEKVVPLKARLESAQQRLRQQGLSSSELTEAGLTLGFVISDVAVAMDVGWKELPSPESKAEELEVAKVEIQRDMWRAVTLVTSAGEYEQLGDELQQFADRYRKLAPLQREVAELQAGKSPGFSRYREFTHGLGFQTADKLAKHQEKYGENQRVQDGLTAIKNAESELTGIQVEADNRVAIDNSKRRNQRPSQRPSGNRPPRGGSSGSADLGAPDGAANAGPELALRRFVNRHGQQNVVIIRVTNASDLKPGVLTRELIARLDTRAFFATRPAESAIMAVRFPGALDKVIPHIDWGRVTSSDEKRRLIFVDGAVKKN